MKWHETVWTGEDGLPTPDQRRCMYKIIRFYRDSGKRRTIKRGLTLAQAQEHCKDPETSWRTCTSTTGKRRTRDNGPWFDGYTEE